MSDVYISALGILVALVQVGRVVVLHRVDPNFVILRGSRYIGYLPGIVFALDRLHYIIGILRRIL